MGVKGSNNQSQLPHYLSAMQKINQAVASFNDADKALAVALEIIATTVELEACLVLRYDAVVESLLPISIFHGIKGLEAEALSQIELSVKNGLNYPSLQAFKQVSLVQLKHSESLEEETVSKEFNLRQFQVRSQVAVPILSEGRPQWIFVGLNYSRQAFDEVEQQELVNLCASLTMLLRNLDLASNLDYEKRRQQALLDAAVDGFIEVDTNKRIIFFNRGAESLTGWKAEEAIGLTCREVLQPRTENGKSLCDNCPLDRSFRYRAPVTNMEALIHTRDGENNWVSSSYNANINDKGQIVSGVIAIKDIYRIKALSEELKEELQRQQSLLGVINAINGLSSIDEIYRRALEEIANTIHFDLGTIHSLNPDTKQLTLMTLCEPKHVAEPEPVLEFPNKSVSECFGENEDEGTDAPLNFEYDAFFDTSSSTSGHPPLIDPETTVTLPAISNSEYMVNQQGIKIHRHKDMSNCEALVQNQPYLAANLPGRAVCQVLSDFEGLQAHMCVPIKVQDYTYGVLHLASRQPYAFLGGDLTLAHNISKQIAVAAERAHYIEERDKLARTDALTGLYNKRELWERMKSELHRAERQMQPLSFMIIDLDHLKWFNDFYGHSQGDALLAKLGQMIRGRCRATDVAFRFGGDELCLLLPDTQPEEARVVAERLRLDTSELRVVPPGDDIVIGGDYAVTLSIGIAAFPYHAQSVSDLFERADSAVYRAKATGRNKVCIYDNEVDTMPKPAFERRQADRVSYVDDRLPPFASQIVSRNSINPAHLDQPYSQADIVGVGDVSHFENSSNPLEHNSEYKSVQADFNLNNQDTALEITSEEFLKYGQSKVRVSGTTGTPAKKKHHVNRLRVRRPEPSIS